MDDVIYEQNIICMKSHTNKFETIFIPGSHAKRRELGNAKKTEIKLQHCQNIPFVRLFHATVAIINLADVINLECIYFNS